VYAFSKKDGVNYLEENPCGALSIATFSNPDRLCTVKGMISGQENSSKNDPLTQPKAAKILYKRDEEFPLDEVISV